MGAFPCREAPILFLSRDCNSQSCAAALPALPAIMDYPPSMSHTFAARITWAVNVLIAIAAVTALTVFTLIITILLYSLNIPVIRLYEGYPWMDSWVGQWCRKRDGRTESSATSAPAKNPLTAINNTTSNSWNGE